VGAARHDAFCQIRSRGPAAEQWLDWILRQSHAEENRRHGAVPLLTSRGGVRTEATVFREGRSSSISCRRGFERHDWDYFQNCSERRLGAHAEGHDAVRRVRAGGPARAICCRSSPTRICRTPPSVLTGKPISVGLTQARALRVNFVGELAGSCIIHRDAEHAVRPAVCGGCCVRSEALRHQGHGFAAPGESYA